MSTEQPAGPDREAISSYIRETYPETDVVSIEGARSSRSTAKSIWPNFATVVWNDDFD